MSIDEKIREVASRALPSWTYVFDDWYGADKSITKVDLPVVLNILPVAGTLAERNGMIRNAQSCATAFLDKVRRDGTGGDQSEVYNRMLRAAEAFIHELNASGYFQPVENVQYYVIYEQTATIVTGVYLDITLTELVGRC